MKTSGSIHDGTPPSTTTFLLIDCAFQKGCPVSYAHVEPCVLPLKKCQMDLMHVIGVLMFGVFYFSR